MPWLNSCFCSLFVRGNWCTLTPHTWVRVLVRLHVCVRLQKEMLTSVDHMSNWSMALISPAAGAMHEPLLEEISLLNQDNLVAVGRLSRHNPSVSPSMARDAPGQDLWSQVLLVPPASPLWAEVCKARERLGCGSARVGSSPGCAHALAADALEKRRCVQDAQLLLLCVQEGA